MKAIKRANKKIEMCISCAIESKKDKENRTKWIECYRCGAWCYYGCKPQRFERASVEVYNARDLLELMKNLIDFFINVIGRVSPIGVTEVSARKNILDS